MAFIMLFLLMFIGAIVDFGGAFQQYIVLTNAAREGARRYALLPCKADNRTQVASAIENAVVDETGDSNVVLNASNVIITPDPRASCPAAGSPIVVAVERDYPVQFGEFLGSGPLRLHAEASMVYQGLD